MAAFGEPEVGDSNTPVRQMRATQGARAQDQGSTEPGFTPVAAIKTRRNGQAMGQRRMPMGGLRRARRGTA